EAQSFAHWHRFEEDLFLGVGIFGQDKQRFCIESREFARICRLRSSSNPAFVFAQQVPNGAQQLRLQALEIKVNYDKRPMRTIILLQRLFHQRPDALEEIVTQGWLSSSGFRSMGNYRLPVGPRDILLDSYRIAGPQGSVYPVCPLSFVGVT